MYSFHTRIFPHTDFKDLKDCYAASGYAVIDDAVINDEQGRVLCPSANRMATCD